jgi:hypothetical protein
MVWAMPNPKVLQDLLVKVDRAYTHTVDLTAECIRFANQTNPYETFFEDNLETGERTYFIRVHKEMPQLLSALIGDIAQNLRSALDHLAWHLVQSSPVMPKAQDRDIYFPIYATANDYHKGKMKRMQGATGASIQAIDRIEPYCQRDGGGMGDGASLFWLNEINRLDKHRLLVPVWGMMVSHTFPRTKRTELPEELRVALGEGPIYIHATAESPGSLKDGCKLLTLPIADADDDMRFQVRLAFGEPECVRGKDIATSLAAMEKRVREIVLGFDKEGLL